MAKNFQYSSAGLQLTESMEGLRLTAYQDVANVWTIGYGHTGKDVYAGLTITADQAQVLLQDDVESAVACVNRAVTSIINQNQFDAMVDFAFNVGRGHFISSTLLRKVNASDFAGAVEQFGAWIYAGGQVVAGLVRRRHAEAALFESNAT